MRRRSLAILTIALSLTIASPSVYAGSQEPPIGPAPGPPKAPAEKAKPAQSKPSDQPEKKRILEPPFDLSREFSVVKSPQPGESLDAKPDKEDRREPLRKRSEERPSPEATPSEPKQSGPIGKWLKPTDPDPESKPSDETSDERSPAENPNLRQEQGSKPTPRVAEAKPSGSPPEKHPEQDPPNRFPGNQPLGTKPSGKAQSDRITASTGNDSPDRSIKIAEAKTAERGSKSDENAEVATSSAQTDRQLPRTEETPMPKTASHGPQLMIVGLLTAAIGRLGRKFGSSEG